jgi:glycopeptide antibiotics resistance protein
MILSWLIGSIGLALIAAAPMVLIGTVVIAWRRRTRSWTDAAVPVVRVLAIPTVVLVILVFALRPGDIVPGDTYAINLEPFRDLRRSVEFGQSVSIDIQNLVGNAAMFVPLGLAIAWVFPGSRFLPVLLVAIALSVTIEVAQSTPSVGRSSDITDVIMNTTGAGIGFVVGRAVLRWKRARSMASPDDAPGPVTT